MLDDGLRLDWTGEARGWTRELMGARSKIRRLEAAGPEGTTPSPRTAIPPRRPGLRRLGVPAGRPNAVDPARSDCCRACLLARPASPPMVRSPTRTPGRERGAGRRAAPWSRRLARRLGRGRGA